jgi:C-terminal processing protease CtpA/Prc
MRQLEMEQVRLDNYGFYRAERLPGNIGYLDFRYFHDAGEGGPTAIAAMNFLGNCDALIFDMRRNGGGEPSMIQLISSYLFDEPRHLNSFYIRAKDTIQQFWTSAYVQGRRMSNIDVYVLTSSFTFSGAEEFSYNLKNMKRGTIIGETTGGGAHPVEGHVFLNLNVEIGVPYGRAINPITHTNWEGVGVKPDIEVPASEALTVARVEALKKLRDKATSEDRRRVFNWELEAVESEQHPVQVDPAAAKRYAGAYGPRRITVENGELYYQRERRPKYRMIPMTPATFRLDAPDMGGFRLRFVANEQGTITEAVGLYSDGREDHTPRTGD